MSGIYTPNTDMPKNCGSCPYNENSCYCSKTKSEIDRDYEYAERLADCPLVEVADEERMALAMLAGARAIEQSPRKYLERIFVNEAFGINTKEITYCEAAKKLREAAEAVLKKGK